LNIFKLVEMAEPGIGRDWRTVYRVIVQILLSNIYQVGDRRHPLTGFAGAKRVLVPWIN
jgi:hypothetical protein